MSNLEDRLVTFFMLFIIGLAALMLIVIVVLMILSFTGVIQFTHDPNYTPSPIIICQKIGTANICNSY